MNEKKLEPSVGKRPTFLFFLSENKACNWLILYPCREKGTCGGGTNFVLNSNTTLTFSPRIVVGRHVHVHVFRFDSTVVVP